MYVFSSLVLYKYNNINSRYLYVCMYLCIYILVCSDQTILIMWLIICDRILENSSKSHIKSSVFLHVFNDISTYMYVFTEYFLHSFSNLSIEFLVVL